ncbi:ADP-ribosyltransferase [Streptococcus merionis]|uniref:ADP-ribosyltransferase n=1 Tax=Streptococcus merionis TaxID=400065 RepID=UPI0035146C34
MVMKHRVLRLLLALSCVLSLFIGQGTVLAVGYYDETDSVVFSKDAAYFKFNDPDVTKYIVRNRFAKNVVFTEAEKQIMYDYTYNKATPINSSIDAAKGEIATLNPELQEEIALLDQATHKMTIPWDIIVYRYVYQSFLLDLGLTEEDLANYYVNGQFAPEILDRIVPGTLYTKYSFMSTTALKNGAMTHRPIELRIRVNRGSQAAFVEPYSYFPSELEFLFPRESTLEVIGAYLSEDHKRLNIEVNFKGSL